MLKGFLIYGYLFFSILAFGQSKKVDLVNFDTQKLNALLVDYTNQLRLEKRKKQLEYYPTLDKAASIHAIYMANRKYLGHVQRNRKFRTVIDRVKAFGYLPEFVGENIQFISIQYKIDVENKMLTYFQLSKILGDNWKESRGHYLNMIDFRYTGVSHQFAIKDGLLYVCQVFSSL